MSFAVNEDMFGRYCRIPTDTSGNMHVYKIVSRINSNSYCNVPLTMQSKKTLHMQTVPVLLVIHCGIDETNVQRVALSDCEIVPADVQEVRHGHWIEDKETGCLICSECGRFTDEIIGDMIEQDGKIIHRSMNPFYCSKCGAKMDGKE